jgi:hypothetical protein
MKKIAASVGLVVILLVALPVMSRSTNCGGNSAALSYTQGVALTVIMALDEREGEAPTAFDSLVPPPTWSQVFGFGWGVKSYWVRKDIAPSETGPIVVCAQCFGNVPQPTLWNLYHRNPAFAAAFLRGRTRLLGMDEYNSLDFHKYQYVTKDDVSKRIGPRD